MRNHRWEDCFIQIKDLIWIELLHLLLHGALYHVINMYFFFTLCINMLTYEDNVKPYKSVCITKTMSTDHSSSVYGKIISSLTYCLCWPVLNLRWSHVAIPIAGLAIQLLHCCALFLFRVLFCFEKAVKEDSFYHCNVVNFVPVFFSVF